MNKNKIKCSSQISHCGPVGKKPIAMAQVPANVSVFFVFWFFSSMNLSIYSCTVIITVAHPDNGLFLRECIEIHCNPFFLFK